MTKQTDWTYHGSPDMTATVCVDADGHTITEIMECGTIKPEPPTPPIDADEARAWGRTAFEMGLTLERARRDIADSGCPDRHLAEVDAGYDRAKSEALHREG